MYENHSKSLSCIFCIYLYSIRKVVETITSVFNHVLSIKYLFRRKSSRGQKTSVVNIIMSLSFCRRAQTLVIIVSTFETSTVRYANVTSLLKTTKCHKSNRDFLNVLPCVWIALLSGQAPDMLLESSFVDSFELGWPLLQIFVVLKKKAAVDHFLPNVIEW